MANCDLMSTCQFVNLKMATMPATAQLLKGMYCKGNPCQCARYKAASVVGIDTIPLDLSPSDDEIAERMVAAFNCPA